MDLYKYTFFKAQLLSRLYGAHGKDAPQWLDPLLESGRLVGSELEEVLLALLYCAMGARRIPVEAMLEKFEKPQLIELLERSIDKFVAFDDTDSDSWRDLFDFVSWYAPTHQQIFRLIFIKQSIGKSNIDPLTKELLEDQAESVLDDIKKISTRETTS